MAVAFFNPAPAFEPHLKRSYWVSSIPRTGEPETDARREESYLREYNDYGLQNLSIHEAFPGHYVQFYYALNSLSLIHISEPTRLLSISYAVFCLKKKKNT